MAGKREKPEEIVSKLQQVEGLQGQGATIAEAARQISVTQQTFYRWRTTLAMALSDKKLANAFFKLGIHASSVVCCRVSPK